MADTKQQRETKIYQIVAGVLMVALIMFGILDLMNVI